MTQRLVENTLHTLAHFRLYRLSCIHSIDVYLIFRTKLFSIIYFTKQFK